MNLEDKHKGLVIEKLKLLKLMHQCLPTISKNGPRQRGTINTR